MKILLIVLGITSLVLGITGILLPLLPTTPFILLSAFCFAQSSDRLHDWLIQHPYFGATIHDWRQNGTISKKNKFYALVLIILTILLSVFIQLSPAVLVIQIGVLSLVSLFILTRPHGS